MLSIPHRTQSQKTLAEKPKIKTEKKYLKNRQIIKYLKMEIFEFLSIWKSFSSGFKDSLKRSVMIKKIFENDFGWRLGDFEIMRMNYLFENFLSETTIFNCLRSNIELNKKFLHENSYGRFNINEEGEMMYNNQIITQIPLPEDSLDLFHEIINLPIYYSVGNNYDYDDDLSFLKNLNWICCYREQGVLSKLLKTFESDNLIGLVLTNCRIIKIDNLISKLPLIKYLNISNNWIHAFNRSDYEFSDRDQMSHTGISDISCLKNLSLEKLDVSDNEVLFNFTVIHGSDIKILNCKNTSLSRSALEILKKNLPNTLIIENTKPEVDEEDNNEKELNYDDNSEYPTNRDAFDTDEQYFDWLNN